MTSFIEVCHCRSSQFQPLPDEPTPVSLCAKCKKVIPGEQRHGSLTQWIFRFDSCSCVEPQPVQSRLRAPADSPHVQTANVEFFSSPEDETELAVNNEQFPIERYKPLAILGQGASGTVFLARDRLLHKKVALKVLHHLDGQQLISFQEEAKLTSRLDHPNIIRVLDFGPTASGVPYMVLDYSDRVVSLQQSLKENGPLEQGLAIEVFAKVAEALVHAHGNGVFHRDLKPSNILFTYSDHQEVIVKLIDFGVATSKEEQLDKTSSSRTTVVGTVGYMAAELAAGATYNVACEIYSLGCVLFESLTGRLPFVAESPIEMLHRHANQTAPALSLVAGKRFSAKLERLVADCLAKHPSARPKSVSEFLDRLNTSLDSETSNQVSPLLAQTSELSQKRTVSKPAPGLEKTLIFASAFLICGSLVAALFYFNRSETKAPEVKSLEAQPWGSMAGDPLGVSKSEESFENAQTGKVFDSELSVEFQTIKEISVTNPSKIIEIRLKNCLIAAPDAFAHVSDYKNLKVFSAVSCSKIPVAMNSLANGLSKISSTEKVAKAENLLEKPLFLDFSDSDIDLESVRQLQKIASIVSISLAGSKVDDRVVDVLKTFPNLRGVDLSRTQITELGVKKLTELPTLLLLRVYRCQNIVKPAPFAVLRDTTVSYDEPKTILDHEFPIYWDAAQAKNPAAYVHLASAYYSGRGVKRDFEEAARWYKKAAQSGMTRAQLSLGQMYSLGLIKSDAKARNALKWYLMAAKQNDPLAMFRVGVIYSRTGDGVVAEPRIALKWLHQAAAKNVPTAEVAIGNLYGNGALGSKNPDLALDWYRKGAAKNDGIALDLVGTAYLEGTQVPKNLKTAAAYFKKSADIGSEVGQYDLGCLYLAGQGVKQDFSLAKKLFEESAQKGHPNAIANLGFLYDKGLGVERDYAKAITYYKSALRWQHTEAMVALGDIYRDGKGVPRDQRLAQAYYHRAASLGDVNAKRRLGL